MSWNYLPYGYHDLGYLFSLERGISAPKDWVHPLFLPLLGGGRFLLEALGYQGNMLLPLELANLGLSCLVLTGLFLGAAAVSGEYPVAAAGTLLLAFSPGFWSGALRPDPYAAAAAGATACLGLLAWRRSGRAEIRFALGGAAGGLAAGLHLSGLALLPAAAVAAWSEADASRRGAGLMGAFAGAFAGALLLCYGVFAALGWGDFESLWRADPRELFSKVEQYPLSSIYTSLDPLKQVLDFLHTVKNQGALPLAALGVAGAVLLARRRGLDRRGTAAVAPAGAHMLFFSLFFIINNTYNGFVYAALLPTPLVLAVSAGGNVFLSRLLAPALLTAAAFGAVSGLPWGPNGDPVLQDARYLGRLIGRGEMLVVASCPPSELLFLRRFDVLGEAGASDAACEFPTADSATLRARIAERLGRGRRVFIPAESGLSARLSPWFNADCRYESPSGRRYCALRKGKIPSANRPAASAPWRGDLDALRRVLVRGKADGALLRRVDYLIGWLKESPKDSHAAADLRCAASGWLEGEIERAGLGSPPEDDLPARLLRSSLEFDALLGETALLGPSPDCRREGGKRLSAAGRARVLARWRRVRERWSRLEATGDAGRKILAAPGESERLVNEGVSLFKSGRTAQAEASFRAAVKAYEENPSAWLSLGAVLADSGRHSEALACYEELLSRNLVEGDPLADALAARANALAKLGRAAEARAGRMEALRIAGPSWPSRPALRRALGR